MTHRKYWGSGGNRRWQEGAGGRKRGQEEEAGGGCVEGNSRKAGRIYVGVNRMK